MKRPGILTVCVAVHCREEGGRVRGLGSAIIDNEQRAGFSVLILNLSVRCCCEKLRKTSRST